MPIICKHFSLAPSLLRQVVRSLEVIFGAVRAASHLALIFSPSSFLVKCFPSSILIKLFRSSLLGIRIQPIKNTRNTLTTIYCNKNHLLSLNVEIDKFFEVGAGNIGGKGVELVRRILILVTTTVKPDSDTERNVSKDKCTYKIIQKGLT